MARDEKRWKTWQLASAAALTLILGAAAGASSSSSDKEALAEANRKATAAQAQADDMTRKAGTASGDLERALRATSTAPPLTTTPPSTTRAPATTAPTTTEPPGPKTTFGGDGTYRVGADIAPGTYRTAGPKASGSFSLCYWERQSDLSGTFGAIIANDNLQGPGVVAIAASDKGFKTSGCQSWSQV